jgi:hypothetical protein
LGTNSIDFTLCPAEPFAGLFFAQNASGNMKFPPFLSDRKVERSSELRKIPLIANFGKPSFGNDCLTNEFF